MAIPTLDDLTPALDRACADRLGETIQYAANGSTYVPIKADVDYRDMLKPFEGAQAATQDILVSGMLKVDVAAEPTSSARLTLTRRPGLTFKPINVRTDESGTGWEFEVKRA